MTPELRAAMVGSNPMTIFQLTRYVDRGHVAPGFPPADRDAGHP